MTPHVYLFIPSYGAHCSGTVETVLSAGSAVRVTVKTLASSLLARNFNEGWAMALNGRSRLGLTHFAMLHADIEAEPGWLDTLFWELVKHDADMVSAVMPLKDDRGITSTAVTSEPDDVWGIERRVTMAELAALPDTFTAADYGYPGRALLVNSGCWIAPLTRSWCEDVGNHFFTINDRIIRGDDGVFRVQVESEDWFWSRRLHAAGCKVMATKRVRARHFGNKGWTNYGVWGTHATDEVV